MWGIQIRSSIPQASLTQHYGLSQTPSQLPSVDLQSVLFAVMILIVGRILIYKIMSGVFNIDEQQQPPQQRRPDTLEFSYFYHLAIVVLVLSDVNWNAFDLGIWVGSYVIVGKLRHTIHQIRLQKDLLLNDYSYDKRIVSLLASSKVYGGLLLVASLCYFVGVHVVFFGVSLRITSLLVFPTLMLAIDSAFLLAGSLATGNDILCYFNPNITGVSPGQKLNLAQEMVCNTVRAWHYYNLFRLFFRTFLDKIEFLDCMWVLSVLNAAYLSTAALLRSFKDYRAYNRLIKSINLLFKPSPSAPQQICIICMEQLLNCRSLKGCGHLFHYKCLFQWVQTKNECPICRLPINLDI